MTICLADSHCHLPLIECGDDGVSGVIARAREAGVAYLLCVSVDLESVHDVLDTARRYTSVCASVGVHPNASTETKEPSIAELVELAQGPEVVALGETGLDYFYGAENAETQQRRLRTHIAAAREVGKPLIIHCRDASADLLAILRSEGAAEVGGVMHCFVDDWATAAAALELGFYISFSGILTFKSAADIRAVASRVPAERLLVETDSPWLAPVPRRGKQNEPAYVAHTAACLAEIRGISVEEVAEITTANYLRLFQLEP